MAVSGGAWPITRGAAAAWPTRVPALQGGGVDARRRRATALLLRACAGACEACVAKGEVRRREAGWRTRWSTGRPLGGSDLQRRRPAGAARRGWHGVDWRRPARARARPGRTGSGLTGHIGCRGAASGGRARNEWDESTRAGLARWRHGGAPAAHASASGQPQRSTMLIRRQESLFFATALPMEQIWLRQAWRRRIIAHRTRDEQSEREKARLRAAL